MKICVVGAGAIGGLLAARLAHAGETVTVIARGPHLAAIRGDGLKLIEAAGEEIVAEVAATDTIAEAGRQDLVILGMKAHQLPAVATSLAALYGGDTAVMTAQNGIPWWYFHKHGGAHQGTTLESVDPGGVIAANLPVERVVGAIVYPAAEIVRPGVIRHVENNRFSLGEIDDTRTPRIKALSETFRKAGFKAPVTSDIRAELWTKLWGNLSFNPISALTHATLDDICRFGLTRDLAAAMMREAQAVGEALGIAFRVSLDKRIAGVEAVGPHKTSMLQDVEQGRALEADALIGSVIELGRIAGVPTPRIETAYAMVKLLGKMLQRASAGLAIRSG